VYGNKNKQNLLIKREYKKLATVKQSARNLGLFSSVSAANFKSELPKTAQ
jgi:hypothetical protein